jgi:hypothetical protein
MTVSLMNHRLTISVHPEVYAICRLEPDASVPAWARGPRFFSITRTAAELTIVCEESGVPADVHAERRRKLLQVEGVLAFSLSGILFSLAAPLAEEAISIFAVSTYETDYLFVSLHDLDRAVQALERAGHTILRRMA